MGHFLDCYGTDVAETAQRLGVFTEEQFKNLDRSKLALLTSIPMLLKLLQTKHSDLSAPMICSQKRAAPTSPKETLRPAKQLFTSTPAADKQLTSLQSSTYENTLNIQEADYEANLRRDFKVTELQYNTTDIEFAAQSESQNDQLSMVESLPRTEPSTSRVLATSKHQNSSAETRSVTQRPLSREVRQWCNGLDLCTSILYPAIPLAKVQHLKEIPDSEDMPARYQQIILGTYAEHAMYQYNKQFGTRYVDKMVKTHLAESLVGIFPCLGDKFASESGHSYLFQESPQGGILYSVFKNKQFRLPAEERLRKPRNKSKEIEVDTITEDEYKKLVTQLKEAASYGTKEKEAMVQTFGKRRVCLSKKESIAAVIEEFPIFSTNPVEIDLEFRRIHPKAKFDDEKFRQHVEKFLDGKDTRDLIKKTLLDLSRRAKVDDLISDKDPVSVVAQKIVMTLFSGRVTVCLPGGTRLGSESIISGLMLMLKCHYVFHEHYTKSVKCFYAVLEGLAGIPITVHAGAKSSRIVNEILD